MPSTPVLVLQLDPSDPPARLGEWLGAAGVELDVRALDTGEPVPERLDEHAGLVVLGGPMGANDDATVPFLPAVRALLRTAVSDEVPTLGVCLGHQLLATANGGRVRRMPEGPEIGNQLVAKRTAAAGDPLFEALPITPDVIQWHYDEVAALPPGAVQLATSPASDLQAFRLGRLAWGVQFHIETTPEIIRSWAAEHDDLDDDYLAAVVERAVAAHDDVAEVWAPFAERFAGIVRDPGSAQVNEAPLDPMAAARAALANEASASRGAPTVLPMLPTPSPRPDGDGTD